MDNDRILDKDGKLQDELNPVIEHGFVQHEPFPPPIVYTDPCPDCARLKALLADLSDRLEEIETHADHQIPYYAFGDNEAGCNMSSRLATILHIANELEARIKQEENMNVDKGCVSHHFACECREAAMKNLIDDLIKDLSIEYARYDNDVRMEILNNYKQRAKKLFEDLT